MLRLVGDVLSPSGPRGKLTILTFHRVQTALDPQLEDGFDAVTFSRHMAFLKDEFNMLQLSEACARLARGNLPARAASITFDDGYADNEEIAFPILKGLGLRATFFVSPGYSEGGMMFNDIITEAVRRAPAGRYDLSGLDLGTWELAAGDRSRWAAAEGLIGRLKYRSFSERSALAEQVAAALGGTQHERLMMRPEQISRLHAGGMEIGAHTMNHPILAVLDEQEARSEIVDGKRRLEEIIGAPVSLFAYPNGKPGADYGPRDVQLVREAGFAAAVSTQRGSAHGASDPFQLPRFSPWGSNPLKLGMRLLESCMRASA